MSELARLEEMLRDTDEQIIGLMQAIAQSSKERSSHDMADELNLLSLRKRKQRLEEQIANQPTAAKFGQAALVGISSIVRTIANIIGVRDKAG
jgi:hypothetical protein